MSKQGNAQLPGAVHDGKGFGLVSPWPNSSGALPMPPKLPQPRPTAENLEPGASQIRVAHRMEHRPSVGTLESHPTRWGLAANEGSMAMPYHGKQTCFLEPQRSVPVTDKPTPDWRHRGVRIVRGDQLDPNTPQTPGMSRAAAIDGPWPEPARLGRHRRYSARRQDRTHHPASSRVSSTWCGGRARMRWGERLEYVAEAGRGISSMSRPSSLTRR